MGFLLEDIIFHLPPIKAEQSLISDPSSVCLHPAPAKPALTSNFSFLQHTCKQSISSRHTHTRLLSGIFMMSAARLCRGRRDGGNTTNKKPAALHAREAPSIC